MIAKTFLPKKNRKKDAAQGMVEFALVIPILLLVVYGLLGTDLALNKRKPFV